MIQNYSFEEARLKMIEILARDWTVKSMNLIYDEEKNCLWIDYECFEEEEFEKIDTALR